MGKSGRTVQLTEDEIKAICEEAATRGVKKYIDESEKTERQRSSSLLYNTKVLLENYWKFKAYIEKSVKTLEDATGVELSDRDIDIMRIFGIVEDDRHIHSVQRSVTIMTMLMAHVDRMLDVYRASCEGSASAVEQRKWQVIERMYLREKKMSTNQIAAEFSIDPRAIREDARLAREDIKVLLFGIEAIVQDMK